LRTLLLILLVSVHSIFAQKILTVNSTKEVQLSGYIEVFDDTTFQLNLSEIITLQKQGKFKPLPKKELKYGISKANHWLHFRLNSTVENDLILELDNPRLNSVSFFQIFDNITEIQIVTGDNFTFKTRIFENKNWVFPLKSSEKTRDIFVLVNKQYESIAVNINLYEAKNFIELAQQNYLTWGILFGLTLIVLLMNLFIYIATKDAIYGWFLLIILTSAFHILAASGLGFQYIWGNFPRFNGWYPQTFSTWLLILFQMYFMQLFIGQNHLNSKVFRFVKLFVYSIIVLIFLFSGLLFFDLIPKQFFQLILVTSLILNLLVIPIAIASIFERIQKREPIILFFAVVSVFKALVLLFYLANQLFRFTKFDSLQVVLYDFLFDLIVLSIGVIYFGFSKYREQNEQLLVTIHKNEQEQSKKIIEALEIERNRIAEDLYDDVGAMLSTAIGYQSNVLRKDDNKKKFPLLVESRKLLDKAVENLRTVSHNLMPKNFAEIGLSKSLKETINKVGKNSDITFTYFLVGQEIKLDASKEVQIFRIAVELINDILKNSGAKNATIQLIYGKNSLTLMAEDDGPGQPFHNNLTSKVDFINGKLDINFSPSGLTAVVEIPY
jgi:two-component system, sensor histidine kinase LadS